MVVGVQVHADRATALVRYHRNVLDLGGGEDSPALGVTLEPVADRLLSRQYLLVRAHTGGDVLAVCPASEAAGSASRRDRATHKRRPCSQEEDHLLACAVLFVVAHRSGNCLCQREGRKPALPVAPSRRVTWCALIRSAALFGFRSLRETGYAARIKAKLPTLPDQATLPCKEMRTALKNRAEMPSGGVTRRWRTACAAPGHSSAQCSVTG